MANSDQAVIEVYVYVLRDSDDLFIKSKALSEPPAVNRQISIR